VLLGNTGFDTLGLLREDIQNQGMKISLAQVSKAVAALQQERILGSRGRALYLLDPDKLMEQLLASWKPEVKKRVYLRLPDIDSSLRRLNLDSELDWAVTGVSSVKYYTNLAQGGHSKLPFQIYQQHSSCSMVKRKTSPTLPTSNSSKAPNLRITTPTRWTMESDGPTNYRSG